MMTAPEINPKGAKKLPPFRIVVHDSGGYDIYWPDPPAAASCRYWLLPPELTEACHGNVSPRIPL